MDTKTDQPDSKLIESISLSRGLDTMQMAGHLDWIVILATFVATPQAFYLSIRLHVVLHLQLVLGHFI